MTKDIPEDQSRRDREALLALAILTAADIDNARDYWNAHAPPALKGIPTGDGWTWDEPTQTYLGRNRHKADRHDLKRLTLLFALAAEADMRNVSTELARRRITVPQWSQQMARLVKDEYIAQAAVASGGFDKLTPEVLARTAGTIEQVPSVAFSLGKLADFEIDIYKARPRADSEAAITSRAALYAASGNGVYEDAARESHKRAVDEDGELAFKYERNILGPAERHCRDDGDTLGCITCTDAGWVSLGSLPPIGQRTCAANCQCSMEFSLTGGEQENN